MKGDEVILLAHGGGGTRTGELVSGIILRHLGNPVLDRLDDSACMELPGTSIVFTTDSYVVRPIFFPGGDIGRLAACGTINDLAMQGGEPFCLSLGLILTEGLRVADLERVIASLAAVTREVGVPVVCGDTKVIGRSADPSEEPGLLINTAGIGMRVPGVDVHVSNAEPGDAVIVSGTLGDHGIAVMGCRAGLRFESEVVSDAAPLWPLVRGLFDRVPRVHCLRDPTRGGLASALCDIAAASSVGIRIEERALPVRRDVAAACGLLGLDPLNVANEGKAVVVCRPEAAEAALAALRSHPLGRDATVIGRVEGEPAGMVLLHTLAGGERIVEPPSGEDLPRIC